MQESLGIQITSPDPNNPLSGNPGGSLTGENRLHFESNEGIEQRGEYQSERVSTDCARWHADDVPLNFSSTQAANGAGTSSEMVVYDSLGIPLTVRLDDGARIDRQRRDDVSLVRHFARQSTGQRR